MVWCKALRKFGNILHPKLRLNKIIKVAKKCKTFSVVSSTEIHAASSTRMPWWQAPLGLDSNLEITALCIYDGAEKGTKLEFTRPMHSEDSPDKTHDSQENHLNSWCFNDVICQPTSVFTRHNCSCTTASSFPFNYRYLLDLARLSDWISSLSNRPEVVSTLRGERRKGKIRGVKRSRIFVSDHVREICKPNHIIRFILKIFSRTVFCNNSFNLEKKIV